MAADREHLGGHHGSIVVIGGQGNGRRAASVLTKAMPVQPPFSILAKTPVLRAGPAPSCIGRKQVAVEGAEKLKAGEGLVESILNHAVWAGRPSSETNADIFSLPRYRKG